MRLTFTLLLLFIFSSISYSQKLTGIWRGYFVQQDFNPLNGEFVEDKYKYEIQINQLANAGLEGVTYSYKTTVFYGKASFQGIFRKETSNVLIKELKMLELKSIDNDNACAMTCYLDYSKTGTKEILSGNFTSINVKDKSSCPGGSVYLEKVIKSDFKKEPFLLKKSNTKPSIVNPKKDTIATAKKQLVKPNPKNIVADNSKTNPVKKTTPVIPKQNNILKQPTIKPGAEAFLVPKSKTVKKDSSISQNTIPQVTDTIRKQEKIISKKTAPTFTIIPRVLKERSNSLVKTIEIDEKQVQIDYYDNGEIDNDTITVYHNNELAIDHGRLSYNPITLKIQLDEEHPLHEIITVANNLGDVPPNTALMVITTPGRKRYEIFITSDEKTNAKVILEYKPKQPVKIY